MAGKGSKPRPFTDRKVFDENWERIFGKKAPAQEYWEHTCPHNGQVRLEKGNACEWCGAEEDE